MGRFVRLLMAKFVAPAIFWLMAAQLEAMPLAWDVNGATAGTGGTGTWDTSNAFFFDGFIYRAWDNSANAFDTAVFGGTAGAVTLGTSISAGALQFTTTGYSLTGSSLSLSTGLPTVDVATSVTATIDATLTGTAGLTKTGAGTLSLTTNNNSYSGVTAINGGTISVIRLANGGVNSSIGTASSVVLNGGALRYIGSSTATNRTISVGTDGGTIDASGTGALTFSNTAGIGFNSQSGARTLTLTGSSFPGYLNTLAASVNDYGGPTNLVKSGSATWVLSNVNLYTGTTTINDGTLKVGPGGTLGSLSAVTVANASGATIDATSLSSLTIGSLAGGSSFAPGVSLGGAQLTVGGDNTSTTYIGDISGSLGGSLVKVGSGTLSLSGNGSGYSGATTINAGTLAVSVLANGNSSSSIGRSSNFASSLVLNGGTLKYTGSGAATDRLFSVGTSGGTIDGSGSGNLVFDNTGSMGFNSQSGDRTLTLTGSTLAANSLAAVIGDSGGATSLNKSGTGTWILSGANTYTGATTVSAGTLLVSGSLASGSTVNVGTSGTLSGNGAINGSVNLTGNGVIDRSGGVIGGTLGVTGGNWNGTGSVTGLVTSSSGVFTIGSSANLTANGGLSVTGGTLAAASSGSMITGNVNYTSPSNSTFAGTIAGSGKTLTLNNSAAKLTLSGANTYTGATSVLAGTLELAASNATSNISVASGATLTGNGGASGASLTVNGTLAGNGTYGTTLINSGSTLAPGNSPGQLNLGTTTISGTGNYNWQIYDATGPAGVGGYDTVSITGELDVANAANYNINLWSLSSIGPDANGNAIHFNPSLAYSWKLWQTTSGVLGFNTANFNINVTPHDLAQGFTNSLASGSFSLGLGNSGKDLVLNFTPFSAVPEPGSLLLASLAAGVLTLRARRRRRAIK